MIVTFKNKMSECTYSGLAWSTTRQQRRFLFCLPWLKGGAWSAHLPLRTLRRTTTNDDDDDEDEASPSGPGSKGGCLVSTPALICHCHPRAC